MRTTISKRLFVTKDGNSRVLATEILVGVQVVINSISNEKVQQIPSVMQTSKALGMRTLHSLVQVLISSGQIFLEDARPYLNVGEYD